MLDLPICQDVMSPAMICTFEVVNHAISTKLDQDSDFGALKKKQGLMNIYIDLYRFL